MQENKSGYFFLNTVYISGADWDYGYNCKTAFSLHVVESASDNNF